MANTDAPSGFTPLRHLTGGVVRPQAYPVANAYATSLFSGDLVTLLSDGTVGIGTNTSNALGVFYGVQYIDRASGDVKFSKVWPARNIQAWSFLLTSTCTCYLLKFLVVQP
jgi:hypothetical protein